MLNFDKTPFSSEEHAIQSQAIPSMKLVAHGGRWGAIILVLQILAFTLPALYQVVRGNADFLLLLVLLVGAGLLMNILPRVFRPVTLELAGKQLYFQGAQAFHCATDNIGRILFDGRAMHFVFRDVASLLPTETQPGVDSVRELQTAVRESVERTGTHFNTTGFSIAQIDELRSAMRMPNLGFNDRAEEMEMFQRKLHAQTPRVWVTSLLVGMNVAVFGCMIAAGVPFLDPTALDVLPWGANFALNTFNGEWWRLFTCMFLHFGVIHLMCNMWAVQDGGPMLERLTGNVGFALLYIFSGFCGSVASVLWSPHAVSAGASGAVFGVFGALVTWHYLRRRDFPPNMFNGIMRSVVPFILFNLMIGASSTNIGQAAHIGGLLAGGVCGLLLSHPLTTGPNYQRLWRNLILAIAGSAIVVFTINHLPRYFPEIIHFSELDARIKADYAVAYEQLRVGEINSEAFERTLREEILPPWIKARDHLATLKFSDPKQQQTISALIQYATLHAEGWTLQADAIQNNDIPHGFAEAQRKHEAAGEIGR